ncbi:hypothetical protein GWK47_049350 [Chionoecetes opilio]|uniref:Uncharacterized protein n=1 Tax=Chionoecetes opilio TaxID=41210 RepID=A0A8J4Y9D9_CHIOP|nr:hypothetical protein GWK47_049350 [Chionoecetes opilio]
MVLLPPVIPGLLDRVQARAQRLARLKAPEAAAQIIQPLQQRRDVAGMCVMYKAHRMQLLQLAELRLNPRARPSHSTRAAHNIDHQVTVPFARTEHYLRSFLPRYGRLWNTLVRQTDLHLTTSMHAFKSGPQQSPPRFSSRSITLKVLSIVLSTLTVLEAHFTTTLLQYHNSPVCVGVVVYMAILHVYRTPLCLPWRSQGFEIQVKENHG